MKASRVPYKLEIRNSNSAFLLVFSSLLCLFLNAPATAVLEQNFLHPPASARPWVYWFWLNGNITSNGVTADLEAMRRVGIGGVLIMEVDQGAPKGPADFGKERWRGLFQHMLAEAHRLGLQVNMNNDAGWCGSGGPWITPELSMQKLVWSETVVRGPTAFRGVLLQPKTATKYYRDVAVFALPTPDADTIKMTDSAPRIIASVMDEKFDARKLQDDDVKTFITLPRPTLSTPQFVQVEF